MVWERLFLLLHVLMAAAELAIGLTTVALLYALGKVLRRTKGCYYALITDEGPDIHTPLPQVEGYTPEGQVLSSRDFIGREFVLLLVSPECAPCHTLLAAVEPVRRSLVEPPSFVVLAECSEAKVQHYMRRYRLQAHVITDPEGAIRSQLGVLRTPYGFLVDAEGIVRMKGVVSHRDHLEALVFRRGRSIGALPWETLVGTDAEAA